MKLHEFTARFAPADAEDIRRVSERYPFKINRHYANLIRCEGDPVWRQAVPDALELEDPAGLEDPLAEEAHSPVPNLVHRYPNRVLWIVTHECATHCRFCTRKRRWTSPVPLTEELFRAGLDYIRRNKAVQDVLISGGDPLILPLARLETIVSSLRRIPHVGIIRIGSRVPCVAPNRVTPGLAAMLARYHPIFMNLHFNHPVEMTAEAERACSLLANAGIPLGNQTVLLKDVNDRAEVLETLFQGLLGWRVRPYYLMQMDLTSGTSHFRTPLSTGLDMLPVLRNRISGPAMPHFVVDLPGGRGKVPLLPSQVLGIEGDSLILRDPAGDPCSYPLVAGEREQWMQSTAK